LQRRTFQRGQIVFREGDPGDMLHIVTRGHLKAFTNAVTGEKAVVAIFGPGDCFGEIAVIDRGTRWATVEALEQVETLSLRGAEFWEILRAEPRMALPLLVVLAGRLRRMTTEVTDLACLDLAGRLARKLGELAERHGVRTDDGVAIDLPLTQEDLAAMVGGTRGSVNRALARFEEAGAIQRLGRQIVVLDAEWLATGPPMRKF